MPSEIHFGQFGLQTFFPKPPHKEIAPPVSAHEQDAPSFAQTIPNRQAQNGLTVVSVMRRNDRSAQIAFQCAAAALPYGNVYLYAV